MPAPTPRHRILSALACCAALLGAPALGAPAAVPGDGEDDPLPFLQQVQAAARTLDYSGIAVYQQGDQLQASRVVHVVDGSGERERFEALDGSPYECLRENHQERCIQPLQRRVMVRPARSDHFPGVLLGNEAAITRHYRWRPDGGQYRVAGRACTLSELRARDTLRYSYRLCTDRENHLLLRAQTLAADGRLIDQRAFSHIRLDAKAAVDALASHWDTRGWPVHDERSEPVDLGALGWRFALPAGFAPIAELGRDLGAGHRVAQLVLSDGLTAISVFIETFDPKRDQNIQQGELRQGAINVYRARLASWWLTAVGEVPAQTVRDLVQAVQYVPQAAH